MSDFEVARSRAERHLAGRVLAPRHEPGHLPPGLTAADLARQRAAALAGALDVYTRLGLFSDEDVEKWRVADAEPRDAAPPPHSAPSAVRMLERRWADVEGAAGDDASYRFMIGHLAASLAGLLSAEDSVAWMRRPQDLAAVSDDDRRRLALLRSTRLRDLRAVIPGPVRRDSGRTLTSVELFADALVVHWRRDMGPREQSFAGLDAAALSDAAGTDYVMLGGGGGGSREQYGTVVFGPLPPADSGPLELVIGMDRFQIDLGPPGSIA